MLAQHLQPLCILLNSTLYFLRSFCGAYKCTFLCVFLKCDFPANLCCRNRRFFVVTPDESASCLRLCKLAPLTLCDLQAVKGCKTGPISVIIVCLTHVLFLMPLSAVFSHHHDNPLGDLPPDSPAPGPPPSGAVSFAASPALVLLRPNAAASPADAPRPFQI